MLAAASFLLAAATAAAAPSALAPGGEYTVRFSAERPLQVSVEAELPVAGGRLYMAGWGADHHPRGWAHYVSGLTVHDLRGRPLAATAVADSAVWRVPVEDGAKVRVRYQVDLSFATERWPYGNEQAAWFQDGVLFTVSKALFVTSAVPGPRQISFVVPAGWALAVPWVEASPRGAGPTYEAADLDGLLENSLVAGRFQPTEIAAGNFTFLLAFPGAGADERNDVSSALRAVVQEYGAMFPATPPTRYLMTVLRGPERDAEAFRHSAAFTEPAALDGESRILWAGTLAHELLHSWIGHAIRPAVYADLQWFTEGFTEYLSLRTLARQRILTEADFTRRLENLLGLYLYFRASPAFSGVTPRSAGASKARNRLGVYNAGAAIAFCLDQRLRAASGGSRTLTDLVRRLHERFGVPGAPLGYDELVAVSSEVAGEEMGGFFSAYVGGEESLPVGSCLAQAGYRSIAQDYAGQLYVTGTQPSAYRADLFGAAAGPAR
jgi:predicted metalloprotease with PDZ domain